MVQLGRPASPLPRHFQGDRRTLAFEKVAYSRVVVPLQGRLNILWWPTMGAENARVDKSSPICQNVRKKNHQMCFLGHVPGQIPPWKSVHMGYFGRLWGQMFLVKCSLEVDRSAPHERIVFVSNHYFEESLTGCRVRSTRNDSHK